MNVPHKILVLLPAYNEEGKIGEAISKINRSEVAEVLVINDGSTDKTSLEAQREKAKVINNIRKSGVGSVIRQGIEYAQKNKFTILVIMAGNGKDDGRQISRLTGPIIKEDYDFVQGSRYCHGGSIGRMPIYRLIATKFIHPFLFSLFSGKRVTDSTNGFRAIKLGIFKDKRINLHQDWLSKYELEPYIFYKAIRLGYKVREIPVSKIYPPLGLGYTKMRPLIDWWSIIRPIFLLGFGIKK